MSRTFDGLWQRRSVTIGDSAPSEAARVHWIQWDGHYLDVRVPHEAGRRPLCGPGTFGGTTSWADPVLTWHHDIDSEPGPDADEGTVRWLAEDLLEERGLAVLDGASTEYVEVWTRISQVPDRGRHWSPAAGSTAVEAGPHRMAAVVDATGTWAAGRSELDATGRWWILEISGDAGLAAVLHPALLDAS